MVFVVGAISLHHPLQNLTASLFNQLVDNYLVIPGLSFNVNAVHPRKTVKHDFESFLLPSIEYRDLARHDKLFSWQASQQ